jgi:hypothetical protein
MPVLNAGLSNALLELRSSVANQLLAESIRNARADCKSWIESGGWPIINPIGRVLEPMLDITRAFPLQSELRELLNLETQAGIAMLMERAISQGKMRQVGGEHIMPCELVNQFINMRNSLVAQAAKVPCVREEIGKLFQSVEACFAATKMRNYLTDNQYAVFTEMLKFQSGASLVELYEANPNAWDGMPDTNAFKIKLHRMKTLLGKHGYPFTVREAKGGSFSWGARP